ncbi:MAG TPA: hypothetical protein VMA55_11130, partial [Acidovorax sp.]|nr:hypothetical protein [Acidovorax sp.]
TAGYAQGMDREQQAQQLAVMNQFRDMQMKGLQSQIARDDREVAERARQDKLVADAFTPITGTNVNQRTGLPGPTMEAAQHIGTQPQVNYQQLIAQGVPAERVKALAEAQNYGRTKVARTVKGMGPDGREYEFQVDDFGQRIGDGLAQYRAPIQADTGGSVQFLDPYTQRPVSRLDKTMSPDAKASNALGWANNDISRERLAIDRQNSASNGYTFNADFGGYVPKAPGGQFVPLEGLPASSKGGNASEGERKAATLLRRMEGSLSQLQGALRDDPSAAKPGFWAEAARNAPLGGGDTAANMLTPEARQRVEAAQLDILDAALTLGTGAAYTKEQLQGYRRSFFPQMFDGPTQVKEKQDRLNNVLEAARIAAGRAAPAPRTQQQPSAQPSSDPLKGFRIVEVN